MAINFRVEPQLLHVLRMVNVDANDAVSFFVETFNKVKTCKPNLNVSGKILDNVWILRDFFPDTGIMFKMTVVYQSPEYQAQYHPRCDDDMLGVSMYQPVTYVKVRLAKHKTYKDIYVSYDKALKYSMAKAANILIGDDIKPEPFVNQVFKKPKRMIPKGYYSEDRPDERPARVHNKRSRGKKDVRSDG